PAEAFLRGELALGEFAHDIRLRLARNSPETLAEQLTEVRDRLIRELETAVAVVERGDIGTALIVARAIRNVIAVALPSHGYVIDNDSEMADSCLESGDEEDDE